MTLTLSPEAERELIDAASHYAQAGNTELGLAFIAAFERTLGALRTYPLLGALWRGTIRRFPLRQFPYNVIYQVKPSEVRVIALAHQRRRPGYWSGRE